MHAPHLAAGTQKVLGWPPLEPGQKNILCVSLINEDSLPTFRIRVAIVRESDHEEVHSQILGEAVAFSTTISFPELADLGRKQNTYLDAVKQLEGVERALSALQEDGTQLAEIHKTRLGSEMLQHSLNKELTVEELDEGREMAHAIQGQACMLMKCAYDALVVGGVPHTVDLFREGVEVRGHANSTSDFTVHGRVQQHGWLGHFFGKQTWMYVPPVLEDDWGFGVKANWRCLGCVPRMLLGRCFGMS
jgi:hypothetical protein